MRTCLRAGLRLVILAMAATTGNAEADTEPQRKIAAPLVLVPGILGSFPRNPKDIDERASIPNRMEWFLAEDAYGNVSALHRVAADVFMHIRIRLMAKGYVWDRELFAAPYDWRKSISDYGALKAWIAYAIVKFNLTRSDDEKTTQADIIAHSLGGLLVRSYLQSREYGGDIRSVAIVASPHFGAADSYYVWAGGLVPPGYSNRFAEFLHGHLAAMNAKIDPQSGRPLVVFVRKYIPSIRDLLPTPADRADREGYVFGWPSPSLTPFARMQPVNRNSTLEQMNEKLRVAVLPARAGLFLANGAKTLDRIEVRAPSQRGVWEDGWPTGKAEWDDGDSRVLFKPNSVVRVAKIVAAGPADHQGAVCVFTPDVFEFLGVKVAPDDRCAADVRRPAPVLAFTLASTSRADVSIVGPQGNKLPGPDGEPAVWRTERFVHVQVDAPATGRYEVGVSGSAGEHNVFVRHAWGPLSVSAVARKFEFGREMRSIWRILLKGDGGLEEEKR